jgi:hypothetical protein
MQMANEYHQKKVKGSLPNAPVQWQEKEVFITVMSEGVGGKL